ncbi:MAG: adenylyltransferase/cytidyltransferase family protein [Bacilli bacterium]|nr:adenylyltransferase/cytidyltransferase family protein [Bacilli bacterium]
MTKVITYGTFDLFHEGHYKLLERAKALGDYLIVGVTSDYFDKCRGKFNVHDSLMTRVKNVEKTGFADEIIVEEYFGQKIDDIKSYDVDIFTVGSDWIGFFDYLGEYCKVVYLERTKGISSTEIRNANNVKLGIIGNEDIVKRFVQELACVSSCELIGIYCNDEDKTILPNVTRFNYMDKLIENCDAVYVNLPLSERYAVIKNVLLSGKHVLTEFPFGDDLDKAKELIELADSKNLVIMEGLKTAYCPAFNKLISIAKSGLVGNIINVEAKFTQILADDLDTQIKIAGGSVVSLGAYPLLAIFKLLGNDYTEVKFYSRIENGVDTYSKIDFSFDGAIASGIVAINAKSEGDLVVTGTKGYIYVPAPWWKTEYFELRYEDINKNSKYFYKFEGEGLRYGIVEFIKCIKDGKKNNMFLSKEDILSEVAVLERYKNSTDVKYF